MNAHRFLPRLGFFAGIGLVLGLLAGGAYALRIPDRFESHSVLMITPRVIIPGVAVENGLGSELKEIDTLLQLASRPDLIDRARWRVADPAGQGKSTAIAFQALGLDARSSRANTVVLKVTAADFSQAQHFVTAWANELVDLQKQLHTSLHSSAEAGLQRTQLLQEQRLERARAALADFRAKNEPALRDTSPDEVTRTLERLNGELLATRTERALLSQTTAAQLASSQLTDRSLSGGTSVAGASDPSAARYFELKFDIRKLEAQLAAGRPAADTPGLQEALREQKQKLTAFLGVLEAARQSRLEQLQRRESELQRLISESRSKALAAVPVRDEQERLVSDEQALKTFMGSLRHQLLNLQSDAGLDQELQPIELGGGSAQPTGPRRGLIAAAGGGTGACLGVLLFLLSLAWSPREPTTLGLAPAT